MMMMMIKIIINKQTQEANADSVNNLMRLYNTSYQHSQYWQEKIT
jgi:hypothetical protein